MENLLYFKQGSLDIMTMRALGSVFFHMFLTSSIAYAIVLGKYERKQRVAGYFLAALLLAALTHGMYDLFLTNGSAIWRIASIVILLLGAIQYGIFLTNVLNLSPFFNATKLIDAHRLKLYLCYGFGAVIIVEYVCVSLVGGASKGNVALISGMTSGGFLVFWLSSRLGSISLHQGEWMPGFCGIIHGSWSAPVKEGTKSLLHTGGYVCVGGLLIYLTVTNPVYGGFYLLRFAWGWFTKKKNAEAVVPAT